MNYISNKEKYDPKYLNIPNICFSLTEKDDEREQKFKRQRIERGFDDSETWALDSTIVDFILPRLTRFRDLTIAFPAGFNSLQEWKETLDCMIMAFQLIHADRNGECISYNNYAEDAEIVDYGLDLFRKWFFALWW
jgi:hypothetical protein